MTEPPPATSPDIYHAIPLIIGDLPAIGKDRQMTEGPRYSYRGIEDILPHIKQLFARYGVHLTPVFDVLVDAETTTSSGKPTRRIVVKGMFRFSANDGSFVAAQTIGEAMDSGDKATNKAMTAALKAALVQTFAVADADDPDHHRPELEGAPVAEPVRYENFDTLKALGPTLAALNLAGAVKDYAGQHGIDLRPGHDEARLATVVIKARQLIVDRVTSATTPVVNASITAPPPVPDTDVVAQARRELDEVLAARAGDAEPGVPADSVDPEVAEVAEDEALARIMDEFGPGTEVVDD